MTLKEIRIYVYKIGKMIRKVLSREVTLKLRPKDKEHI